MKLDSLNKWLTLAANIGVIAGIAFLAIEVSQNTESLDESRKLSAAQAYQSRSDSTREMLLGFIDAGLPEINEKLVNLGWPENGDALSSLTESERQKYIYIETVRWTNIDNLFYQYQQGYISPEFYNSSIVGIIRREADTWEFLGRPGAASPEFEAEVERIINSDQ